MERKIQFIDLRSEKFHLFYALEIVGFFWSLKNAKLLEGCFRKISIRKKTETKQIFPSFWEEISCKIDRRKPTF